MRLLILTGLSAVTLMAQNALLEIYTNKAFLAQRFEVGSGTFTTTVPAFVTTTHCLSQLLAPSTTAP